LGGTVKFGWGDAVVSLPTASAREGVVCLDGGMAGRRDGLPADGGRALAQSVAMVLCVGEDQKRDEARGGVDERLGMRMWYSP
jgi:hypothetical protein